MEGLVVLLGLTLIGVGVVLPISAFIRSGRAVRDTEALRRRLASIAS